jgi:Tol biopolymer transport system component
MRLVGSLRPAARILAACLLLVGCSEEGTLSGPASDGLVFVRQTERGLDLFRARLADGAVRELTRTPDRNEDWPTWSDSAARLAFLTAPTEERSSWDLLVWSAGKRGQAALYESGRTEYFLDWSPTAPTLAYSHQAADGNFVVAQIDIEHNTRLLLARVTGGGILARPSYSFDGRRILAQQVGSGVSQLLVLEPDRNPRLLTGEPAFYDDHGRFTRDDAWVVFDRRASWDAPGDVLLVRPEGGEARNLTESPEHDDHSPRPSPVRTEITFVSDRTGANDVYVLDYESGQLRNLTGTPDQGEWMPQFSPDGERIAFVVLPPAFRVGKAPLDYRQARIAVVDREGRRLFETAGINPYWMPAWR